MLAKSNFAQAPTNMPEILKDPVNLDRIAALGSFIFVKGGSLYEEAVRRGFDVKPV